MSLRVKGALLVSTVLLVVLGIGGCVLYRNMHNLTYYLLKNKAATIVQQVFTIREWVSGHGGVYVRKGEERFVLQVPAFVTKELTKYSSGVRYRLFSFHPINPENAPDPLEKKALKSFAEGDEEFFTLMERGGKRFAVYVTPLRVTPACVRCHPGARVGSVLGGLGVTFSVEREMRTMLRYGLSLGLGGVAVLFVIFFMVAFLLDREVVGKIREVEGAFARVFQGDLEVRLALEGAAEFSSLSRGFNRMVERLCEQEREQERMTERLKLEKEKFQRLFEGAMEGIFFLDKDGKIRDVNPEGLRLLGCEDKGELQGRDFFGDLCPSVELFLKLSSGGEVRESEVVLRRVSGGEVVVDMFWFSVGDLHCIWGYWGTIRDVSEEKSLERQLIKAQRMETLGVLAGGIAHDFNNILSGVLGFVELCLDEVPRDSQVYERLNMCLEALKRGSGLASQLLDFARAREDQMRLLDLNLLVKELSKILKETLPKMIEVDVQLDPQLKFVMADPAQIHQALLNLCINARDAMPQGGRLLLKTENITLEEEDTRLDLPPGNYVVLTVSDTGCGMDEETVKRIFEPFFTTKKERGTGLGLTITNSIVKSHGGAIEVKSQVEKGTTFRVYLPASEVKEERAGKDVYTFFSRKGVGKVLVVDDEPMVRDSVAAMVARLGYEPIKASSGEEALEIYREEGKEIVAVLLDLYMPGMGGIKALEKLMKMEPRPRVIISSGYKDKELEEAVREMGALAYLSKPYGQKDLSEILWKVVGD